MAIIPNAKTGGANIEHTAEGSFGAAGSYYDFRVCDDADPTFPTDTREVKPVSSKGYRDPAKREAQITFEKAMENALTVSTYLTAASDYAASNVAQWAKLFNAAGCQQVGTVSSVTPHLGAQIDAYSSTIAWSNGDTPALAAYQAAALELENGDVFPFLCYSNSGTASYNIVPTMALPSAAGSSNYWYQMMTLTPPKGVSVTYTNGWRLSTHYATSTETGSCWTYSGCATAEIKDVTFESGAPVKIEVTQHCADRAFDQSGIDLSADSYTDAVAIPIIDGGSRFLCGFTDATASGGLTRANLGFRKATWKPGIKTIPVLETGSSTSINGWGGYLATYTGSSIELTVDVDKAYWTTLESSGTQTAKYLELVQPCAITATPASSANSCWGLWMPWCYMVGKVSADLWSDKEMTVTFTLEPSTAGYSASSKTDNGAAPWYLATNYVS